MWTVKSSIWDIVSCMWATKSTMSDVTASMLDVGTYARIFIGTMRAFRSAMLASVTYMWDVEASVNAIQELCALFNPQSGLSQTLRGFLQPLCEMS